MEDLRAVGVAVEIRAQNLPITSHDVGKIFRFVFVTLAEFRMVKI
jgi:hypothetical protein